MICRVSSRRALEFCRGRAKKSDEELLPILVSLLAGVRWYGGELFPLPEALFVLMWLVCELLAWDMGTQVATQSMLYQC